MNKSAKQINNTSLLSSQVKLQMCQSHSIKCRGVVRLSWWVMEKGQTLEERSKIYLALRRKQLQMCRFSPLKVSVRLHAIDDPSIFYSLHPMIWIFFAMRIGCNFHPHVCPEGS